MPARAALAAALLAAAAALLGTRLAARPVVATLAAALGAGLLVVLLVGRGRQRRAAREQAHAEALLERLPLAVLLFTGGGLAYANPAARALFGPTDGRGVAPRALVGDALADAVMEAGETAASIDVEVARDGRALAARAVPTAGDEVLLMVTDLTEARRVDDVRRDFVVNASHELKTPVAGMRALADSIRLAVDRDPERARRMIVRLQEEADRLSQMVRDLLDLARLEESGAQRGRRSVDVAATVRGQLDRFEPLAAKRGIVLAADCAEPAAVVAVPEDLRLVVDNLVENAVRYNRDGGRVDVRVRRDGTQVVLEVEDTGIGIPEADRDRVFERFYRVDKARSRAAGGTGLGLSLVRNAVERHGGTVTVDSVPGEGSLFRVVLPVEGAPAAP